MIVSFGDPATEDLYHGRHTSRMRRVPPDIIEPALVKLDRLNGAAGEKDLRSPPGNRLERLKGEWKGFFSIRVNEQWRIVFRWDDSGATGARLMDDHR